MSHEEWAMHGPAHIILENGHRPHSLAAAIEVAHYAMCLKALGKLF